MPGPIGRKAKAANQGTAAAVAQAPLKDFPKTRAALLEAARERERQERERQNMAKGKPPAEEPPVTETKK